ncbi:hypothetical protein QOT17_012063 [Balamuthia mandrillaris]
MEKREEERLPGYLRDDFDWCCHRIAQLQKETGGVALPLVRCPENDYSHVTNFRTFCKYGLLRKVKEMVAWWNEQGKDQTLLFRAGNRFGETALLLAAKYAQLEVVDYLLTFKGSCDPNFSAITPRRTRDQLPLTSACKSYSRACFARKQTRHIETVLSLLEAGARSSVNDPSDLTTALRAASWTGSQTLLRLLLCYQVAENSRKKPTLAEAMDWIEQLKDCQAVAVPKSTMGKEIFRLKGRAHHARHLLLTRRRREGNEMEAEENEEEAEEFDANEEQDEVQKGRYRISPLEFACREGYWNVVTVMLAKESIRERMQQDQVKWIRRRRPHMTPLHFACLYDILSSFSSSFSSLHRSLLFSSLLFSCFLSCFTALCLLFLVSTWSYSCSRCTSFLVLLYLEP